MNTVELGQAQVRTRTDRKRPLGSTPSPSTPWGPSFRSLSTPFLESAFNDVATGAGRGAAGPDGIRAKDVVERADHFVGELADELLSGSFRPGPIRIDVRHGRRVGIANYRDRVVHRAVFNLLAPIAIPEDGWPSNIAISRAIGRALTREDVRFHARLDIRDCYESIRHAQVLTALEQANVCDKRLLGLIQQLLRAHMHEPHHRSRARTCGLQPGVSLSPALEGLVLRDVLAELKGVIAWRYVDDILILGPTRQAVAHARATVIHRLGELDLQINAAKSEDAPEVDGGVIFLGLRHTRCRGGVTHEVHTAMSPKKLASVVEELTTMINTATDYTVLLSELDRQLKHRYGYYRQFDCQDDFDKIDDAVSTTLRDNLHRLMSEGGDCEAEHGVLMPIGAHSTRMRWWPRGSDGFQPFSMRHGR